LSAAFALARAGHQVTVIEQASELSEVGAGIQLGPNAMRILRDWGLEKPLLDVGLEPISLIVHDAQDDRILTQRRLDDTRQKHDAPYVTLRRADLQNVLLKAALDAGALLQLGQKFDVGVANQYDAIVGCDGLHSKVREHVLQGTRHAGAPRATGHTAYRAMLALDVCPAEFKNKNVQIWLSDKQHVVTYPVNESMMNLVIAQESLPLESYIQSSFLQKLIHVVQSNGGFTEWPLFDRPPLLSSKYYVKGNIALMGDAAHPMKPYLAQGAAMAIEDADALAKAIQTIGLQANVDMALQAYAKSRWKRNAMVQMRSQMQGYAFHASGLMRLARNAVMRVAGARITDMPWLYSYQNS
jgi:salicylate hydroxylase